MSGLRVGRPRGEEKSHLIALRIPESRVREIELFIKNRGIRLAPYCRMLVETGFEKDRAAA